MIHNVFMHTHVLIRRPEWNPSATARAQVLYACLRDGANCEVHTLDLIAQLSAKKPNKIPRKFKKKRVGVKAAKRAEMLDKIQEGEVRVGDKATAFRALAARANCLALDRPDICFGAKELCREFAAPTPQSIFRLKRLVRYLCCKPRLVWRYDYEAQSPNIDVYCDTDVAGCMRTRRSTSGGVATLGSHVVKAWPITQSVVALSSAEAELTGLCLGGATGIGLQSLCADIGLKVRLRLHSDSTAAIGVCGRRGLGRIRHLAAADLWPQDKVRTGAISVHKILGHDNPAHALAKFVGAATLERALARMRIEVQGGRAERAAVINALSLASRGGRLPPLADHSRGVVRL